MLHCVTACTCFCLFMPPLHPCYFCRNFILILALHIIQYHLSALSQVYIGHSQHWHFTPITFTIANCLSMPRSISDHTLDMPNLSVFCVLYSGTYLLLSRPCLRCLLNFIHVGPLLLHCFALFLYPCRPREIPSNTAPSRGLYILHICMCVHNMKPYESDEISEWKQVLRQPAASPQPTSTCTKYQPEDLMV